jgi:hypothetical protein
MLFVVHMFMAQLASTDGDWRTWAPIASIAVAALALLVAMSNRSTAKNALALSKQQEARRVAKLDLSLREALSRRDNAGQCRWIGIEILAVNPTDRDGTIIGADLHISYRFEDRQLLLKLPHVSHSSPFGDARAAIEVPARLPANGALSGWLLFRLDNGVVRGPIDRYDVVVADSRGPTEVLQAWAFREVEDGAATGD